MGALAKAAAVAATLVGATLLAGCVGAEPSHVPATTCEDYLELDDSARDELAQPLSMPPRFAFDAAGVRQLTRAERADAACEAVADPGRTRLVDVHVAPQSFPDCGAYLALDPVVQENWLTRIWDLEALHGTAYAERVEATSIVCRARPGVGVDAASRLVAGYPGAWDAEQFAAYIGTGAPSGPTTDAAPAGRGFSWSTTDPLGYGYTSTIALGELRHGAAGSHPALPTFVVGSCFDYPSADYDGATDAYIPGTLTIMSTTSGFDVTATPLVDAASDSRAPGDLRLGVLLEDAGCSAGEYSGHITDFFTAYETIAPGKSVTIPFFVIVKNYYSPAHPDGLPEALRYLYLLPSNGGSYDDGISLG